MIIYEEDFETFRINNKEDMFRFFIYCYEYAYLSQEFIEKMRKELPTLDMPLINLWYYFELSYNLFELNYYSFNLLKLSIEKSLKELKITTEKNNDYISDFYGNQIDIINSATEDIGIKPLIERPILNLMLVTEENVVFYILNDFKQKILLTLDKYKSYFSTQKFNRGRLLKRKDLELYQEQIIDYLEVFIIYVLLLFKNEKDLNSSLELVESNIDDFYLGYFKVMPEKTKETFKKEFCDLMIEILTRFYNELSENS